MNRDYLEISGLTVSFDGFVAVDGVDLSVLPGDLRFLIGPNGAGKTTLIDAVSGLVPATGSVRYGGQELTGRKVHRIARLGVGRTFQTATVFEELTVLQNLDIAAGRHRGPLTLVRRRKGIPAEVRADAGDGRAHRPGRRPRRRAARTARSSGSRSACCSCRTLGCSCSTSPWPA